MKKSLMILGIILLIGGTVGGTIYLYSSYLDYMIHDSRNPTVLEVLRWESSKWTGTIVIAGSVFSGILLLGISHVIKILEEIRDRINHGSKEISGPS